MTDLPPRAYRHRAMHAHPSFTGRWGCPECHRQNLRGFAKIFLALAVLQLIMGNMTPVVVLMVLAAFAHVGTQT